MLIVLQHLPIPRCVPELLLIIIFLKFSEIGIPWFHIDKKNCEIESNFDSSFFIHFWVFRQWHELFILVFGAVSGTYAHLVRQILSIIEPVEEIKIFWRILLFAFSVARLLVFGRIIFIITFWIFNNERYCVLSFRNTIVEINENIILFTFALMTSCWAEMFSNCCLNFDKISTFIIGRNYHHIILLALKLLVSL